MTDHIPQACIERGEGYAVWEAEIPSDPGALVGCVDDGGALEEATTFTTVTLYRPVKVEATDESVVAYYYTDDINKGLEGKMYVDSRHVRSSPPRRARPAYKFGVNGPEEGIEYDDMPEEFKDD
jgi:hypothetical protein